MVRADNATASMARCRGDVPYRGFTGWCEGSLSRNREESTGRYAR
jgi:hypothetical protein